jgi:energy-coupling factor transport system substrate-specific component
VKLTEKQIALMGMLIALNVAIGGVVHVTKVPIFLDAVGTILAVVLLGAWPGIVVGVFSFFVAAVVINPVYAWFIGTQAVIATFVYLVALHFQVFLSSWRIVVAGILLGVVAGVVSSPVIVLVFGGVSGSGRDLITATLIGAGQQIYKAVLLSGAASEPVDKTMQMLMAYSILKSLPKKILGQFRNRVLEKNGLL